MKAELLMSQRLRCLKKNRVWRRISLIILLVGFPLPQNQSLRLRLYLRETLARAKYFNPSFSLWSLFLNPFLIFLNNYLLLKSRLPQPPQLGGGIETWGLITKFKLKGEQADSIHWVILGLTWDHEQGSDSEFDGSGDRLGEKSGFVIMTSYYTGDHGKWQLFALSFV